MKYVKILFTLALVFTLCAGFSFKKAHKQQVYAFGVSASFTDSIVYYTQIQLLDSVVLDKNGFLPHRDLYSYQLKNHLELQNGQAHRTCMIYFSNSKSKLDKEAAKVIGKYKHNKTNSLKLIDADKFRFTKPEE